LKGVCVPELPEVETIARQLRRVLRNRRIVSADLPTGKLPLHGDPLRFPEALRGIMCTDVTRSGKSIVLHLVSRRCLVFHLGMTGKFLLTPSVLEAPAHTHLVLNLQGRNKLLFCDPRRFGSLHVVNHAGCKDLLEQRASGIDPLSRRFTLSRFSEVLSGGARIKPFLLNQHRVSGLGNIYVSECLFQAGIHPLRIVDSLTKKESVALFVAIKQTVRNATACGGTSISDFCDLYGRPGSYQHHLTVYGRGGDPCVSCGALITSASIAGRTSYFCPHCQPEPVRLR
jgi:formamidopyrimidine-DNA glycosylase